VARLAAPELAAQWPAETTQRWEPRPDAALGARYQRFLEAVGA